MLRHLYTDLDKNAKLPFYFQDYNLIPLAELNMQHNEVIHVEYYCLKCLRGIMLVSLTGNTLY